MSIWSSETLKIRVPEKDLIKPYKESRVAHAAYELSLGVGAFITSNEKKTDLRTSPQLVIPPGQFGLLITEEVVQVPMDAIAFISIKAGIKFRGLVNVSGFHADPGFSGKLKFAVYNAGSQRLVLDRGQRTFLIWFCNLDKSTADRYNGAHLNQEDITSGDVMQIQGEVASPAALKKEIDSLRNNFDNLSQSFRTWKVLLGSLLSGIAILVMTVLINLLIGLVNGN